ncbi:MAG: hypothetical protein AUK48_06095 [Oscillatoriales cyanobacterium CG2_30_44_21]|nr:MAG: hypothetical protein AUK48_06095 [Oscillatoriales cyanobacterium CG2_30_44_21]
MWDIKENQVNELKGHTDYILGANFSADGNKIVTASFDNTARVWNAKGNQVAELRGHTDGVMMAKFTADGSEIVTVSRDKTTRVWKANLENDLDRLLVGLCQKLEDYLSTNPNASDAGKQACQVKI